MAKKKSEQIRSYCSRCGQDTNHDVLREYVEQFRDEYHCDLNYQIASCRGCETKSFRKIFYDIEAAYPLEHDIWEVPKDVTIYPKSIKGHRDLLDLSHIPSTVKGIYSDVLLAIQEEALILAGLGLRGTVEAVCNDLRVTGRTLDIRIGKLIAAGHISKGDAERLHAIRFMGNDAAHDIKRPDSSAVAVALKIIEHLLSSVYILEKEADGNLEPTINKYEKFAALVINSLNNYTIGDEYPLAKFLGKDLRRVKEAVSTLESELIAKINSGEFQALIIGKIDRYNGSISPLQHFIVTKNA
ncbi:MAG: DUF4145 domain-containing protein [Bacteroidetes bacterium]|nr:DUF4145 domain-containing protein [Bacteroidota bacterium]